ncbi:hypothetical protein DXC96_14040 [Enterocloster bolteae]|nr:hypothetical protein DXC96_14040 [Enterocloster bolteae]
MRNRTMFTDLLKYQEEDYLYAATIGS